MALNKDPIFGAAQKRNSIVITAANTNLDGTTGAYTELLTAGADGEIVTSLVAMARATVTATAIRLFSSTDGGTNKHFIMEKLMAAYTVANTTAQTPTVFVNKLNPDEGILLQANEILYCTIAVALAGGIGITAEHSQLTA